MKIFTGSSNPALAQEIVDYLKIDLGRCVLKRFSDGEIRFYIEENVRGEDVFIIQSGCRDANIVLATAPVRTRGVYANINHEALAALGDCRPASLQTIVRTGYDDPAIDATLEPDRLVLRAAAYRGGFVTSADFQRYSTRIDARAATRLTNALGEFAAAPDGPDLVIRQQLRPGSAAGAHWFVFSRGRLRPLAPQ